jgi:rhodanese-related sulfurtransferase
MTSTLPTRTHADVRRALLARQEIALLDVREEAPYAQAHPLFAANLPVSRLEAEAGWRIPRRDTPVTVYDDGEGLAELAAQRLQTLGYSDVALLAGGLAAWRAAGGELFQDVNVPSKAFGELVESQRHTPSLSAQEVAALIREQADVVVLDARPYGEFHTMSIPGATNVPGGELVLRAAAQAPDPHTRIVVNCAGRTRSIIGTQSLVNAGVPNPVCALRNGTIGWTLAGQALDTGAQRRFQAVSETQRSDAAARARAVADRAAVGRCTRAELARLQRDAERTTYCYDVRTPEEYATGHLPGFLSAPGGQLVQETDVYAAVRGARIVLHDDDGVRANMAASWLAQMAWDVRVLDGVDAADRSAVGPAGNTLADLDQPVAWIAPSGLQAALQHPQAPIVLDLGSSAGFVQAHLPGAWWLLRSDLPRALRQVPAAAAVTLVCETGGRSRHAAAEVAALTGAAVTVLQGGRQAWAAAGLATETGEARLASPRTDRYRRPYEGTDNPHSAMQAYLDWEFGLVEQLARDGTHGFRVI